MTKSIVEVDSTQSARIQKWMIEHRFKLVRYTNKIALYKKESRTYINGRTAPFYLEVDDRGEKIILSAWYVVSGAELPFRKHYWDLHPMLISYHEIFHELLALIQSKI